MEIKIKEIKSNWKMTIETILFFTIILGIILNLSWYAFKFLSAGFIVFYYIQFLLEWPFCLITGFVLAVIIALFRKTSITMSDDIILIKRFGFLMEIPKADLIRFHTKRTQIGYDWLQYTIRRRYIVYYNEKKEEKLIRLYDFNASDIETFFEKWRIQQSEHISPLEKSEIVYEAQRDPYSFYLSPDDILSSEKRSLLKIAIIELIFSLSGILVIFLTKNEISLMPLVGLVITILSILMLLIEPVRFYLLHKRGRTCPKSITYMGTFIMVDNNRFCLNEIMEIKMTSPRKKSNSIYPTQYFLCIEPKDGKKIRYWLGSESSFHEYSELCSFVADSMITFSEKFRFIG